VEDETIESRYKMKRQALFIFLVSILLIYLAFQFQDKLSQFKTLGIIGIFLINFFGSATIFLPTPALVSVISGGIIYSVIPVAFSAALGGALGELVGLMLGYSGRQIFIRDHHRLYLFLKAGFSKFADAIIFIFALIPNPFFDAVGITAGVFSFSPVRFIILVFLGRLLRDILLAYLGAKL